MRAVGSAGAGAPVAGGGRSRRRRDGRGRGGDEARYGARSLHGDRCRRVLGCRLHVDEGGDRGWRRPARRLAARQVRRLVISCLGQYVAIVGGVSAEREQLDTAGYWHARWK